MRAISEENVTQQRVDAIVRSELPELITGYRMAGWPRETAILMALAHACGKHNLDPSYAIKLDTLRVRAGATDGVNA